LENALREAAGAASPGLDQQKLTFDREEHASRPDADMGITLHDSPNWTEQSYRTRRELNLSLANALQKHVLSAADVRRLRLLVEGLAQRLDDNDDPDGELRLEAHLVTSDGPAERRRLEVAAEIRAAVRAARPQYSAAQVEEFIARHVVMGVTRTYNYNKLGLFLTVVGRESESAPDPVSDRSVVAVGQAEDLRLTLQPKKLSGRVEKGTDAEIDRWKGELKAGEPFVIVEGARKRLNGFIDKILPDIADRTRNNQQLPDIRLHLTKRTHQVDYGVRHPEHGVLEELVKREALKQSIDLSEFRFTYVTHRSNSSARSVEITVHKTPERGKSHYLEETSLTEFLVRRFDILSEAARERITWLSMGFIRRREHEDGNKILSIAMTRSPNNDADLILRVVRDLVVAAFAGQLPGPEAEREARAILDKSVRITLYRALRPGLPAVLVDVVGTGEVSSVRREERAEQALSTRMASRVAREVEASWRAELRVDGLSWWSPVDEASLVDLVDRIAGNAVVLEREMREPLDIMFRLTDTASRRAEYGSGLLDSLEGRLRGALRAWGVDVDAVRFAFDRVDRNPAEGESPGVEVLVRRSPNRSVRY
ncbi:hypothetical protein, partial [Amycolatopsis decaplanina]|uniref:hypothetical protein n=1 Tax=Amycolatopsis decaplanina TaxID=208441 RepID=UPI0005864B6F